MEHLKRMGIGALGGFLGGALIGLAEAAVVALGGGAEEYWVFVFAAIAYGLFGLAAGIGWAIAAGVLPVDRSPEVILGTAAGLTAAALAVVVARFRITRDLFAEHLPIASGAGIAVHVGLLVGAVIAFALLRGSLRSAARRRGAASAGIVWSAAILVAAVLSAAGLNAVAGGGTAPAVAPATARGPNVVLIIADTLRADRIGPYGSRRVKTPALDGLAADSVVFEHAFAHSSWTRPSIATILTSLYAGSHKVMYKTDLLPDQVTTVAEAMKEAGYRTAGFVTNINVAPSFNFQQGFDSYDYLAPDFFFGATDSGSKLSLYSGMRLVRERFLSSKKYVNHYYQDAPTVNASALPWLERNGREPFFVLIHYMDPHDPYFEIPYDGTAVARVDTPAPEPSRARELSDLYDSNVEYLDRFVGELFAQFKQAGVYDDTIIAFVADHGEEFYEHGGWWHGTTLYDEEIHVPLIVKLPMNQHAGRRVTDLAGAIDVAPTLLAAASVQAPPAFQGRDLFGKAKAPDALFAEEDHEGNILEAVRTATWKLVRANPDNPRGLAPVELYDLGSDPHETTNVAERESDRVASLTAILDDLRKMASSRSVHGVSGEIDAASEERLRALGYIQ